MPQFILQRPTIGLLVRLICVLVTLSLYTSLMAAEQVEADALDPSLLEQTDLSAARVWLKQNASDLDDEAYLSLLKTQIRAGRLAASHLLLDLNRSATLADPRGVSALMTACYFGHGELVSRLLRDGAQVDQRADNGYACFDYALESGQRPVMRMLVNHWLRELADPRSQSERLAHQSLQAVDAILASDASRLSDLIASGIQLNAYNPGNYAPLPLAVRLNEEQLVEQMLKAGAWVGIGNDGEDQAIPLNQAARGNRLDMARLLLSWQASPNKPNGRGYTALMLAALYGNLEMLDLLLAHGADPLRVNHDGDNALTLALATRSMAVIDRLIRIEGLSSDDPLALARQDIFEGTLSDRARANLDEVDRFGLPLSVYLLMRDDTGLLDQAILAGLDVSRADETAAARTLLHHAVRMGRPDQVERLISAGADLHTGSRRGPSAREMAQRSPDPQMRDLFSQPADDQQVD